MKISLVPIYLSVFILSYFCVYLVRLISSKKGWVAHPRDDRWSDRIVAKYGGIGFVPVVLIGIIAVYFNHYPDYDQGLELITLEQKYIFGLMAGAILMFLMGWADDIKNLNPGNFPSHPLGW